MLTARMTCVPLRDCTVTTGFAIMLRYHWERPPHGHHTYVWLPTTCTMTGVCRGRALERPVTVSTTKGQPTSRPRPRRHRTIGSRNTARRAGASGYRLFHSSKRSARG